MPDNKFSGSVDEILENLKQQPTPDPASDRAVEDILAGLGLEEKLPRSARQAAPAAVPAREQKPAPALSLINITEPTRNTLNSYAVVCV